MTTHLRIISLNLGSNVMANVVVGSEASFVKLCQQSYPANGSRDPTTNLSRCTLNAVHMVSDYDLVLLQEVNFKEWSNFEKTLVALGKLKGKSFQSVYHMAQIAIVYDSKILGSGISIEPPKFVFSDYRGIFKDYRGMQAVYFHHKKLMIINLHAPHKIDLSPSITAAIRQIQNVNSNPVYPTRIIIGGDFNDFLGKLLDPKTPPIMAFGFTVHSPKDKVITCCHDVNYKYPGDYILDSEQKKSTYYGHPPGYDRKIHHVSDHDPIVYGAIL